MNFYPPKHRSPKSNFEEDFSLTEPSKKSSALEFFNSQIWDRFKETRKRSTKWIGLLLILVVGFWGGSFLLMGDLNGQLEVTFGETRLLTWSSFLYNRINVVDPKGELISYLFESLPSMKKRDKISLTEPFEIQENHYKYWAKFMNKGSEIRLSLQVESPQPLSLCTITGNDKFEYWSDSGNCESSISIHKELDFFFEVPEDNDYYFIVQYLKNENEPSITGTIRFDLDLVVHDITYADDIYKGSFTQNLYIFNSNWLVFHNPSSSCTLQISYTVFYRPTLHYLSLFFFVFFFVFTSCYLYATRANGTLPNQLHLENGKRYPGISYDTHVFRKTKKVPQTTPSPYLPLPPRLENGRDIPLAMDLEMGYPQQVGLDLEYPNPPL